MRDSPDELVNHARVAAVEPLRSCASINHDEYMEGGGQKGTNQTVRARDCKGIICDTICHARENSQQVTVLKHRKGKGVCSGLGLQQGNDAVVESSIAAKETLSLISSFYLTSSA